MASQLQALEAESPLNATVEQVLPGVREEIRAIRGEMTKGFETVNANVKNEFESLNHDMSDMKRVTNAFRAACVAFSSSENAPSQNLRFASLTEIAPPTIATDTVVDTQHAVFPSQCIIPFQLHESLVSMWDEWHGSGTFQGHPVAGGLNQLEESNGPAWRSHFAPSEKTAFSRMKAIMKGVANYANSKGVAAGVALSELDEIFKSSEVKRQAAKMVSWFQTRDFLEKKRARGKQSTVAH